MVASLKFYTDSGRGTEATADLSNAKIVVYEDGNGNKYTLGSVDKILEKRRKKR